VGQKEGLSGVEQTQPDERRNRTMTTATKKKPCEHEPDPGSASVVTRVDDAWDIGVVCRHCGESGSAWVSAEDVEWQDEDQDEDEA
jgi:hypothetical protein